MRIIIALNDCSSFDKRFKLQKKGNELPFWVIVVYLF